MVDLDSPHRDRNVSSRGRPRRIQWQPQTTLGIVYTKTIVTEQTVRNRLDGFNFHAKRLIRKPTLTVNHQVVHRALVQSTCKVATTAMGLGFCFQTSPVLACNPLIDAFESGVSRRGFCRCRCYEIIQVDAL